MFGFAAKFVDISCHFFLNETGGLPALEVGVDGIQIKIN
jgi:hypothetical protein